MPAAFVRSILLIVPAVVFALAAGCSQSPTDRDIRFVSIAEVRDLMADAERDPKALLLLDARSPKAYAAEHLPTAENMPLYEVEPKRGRKQRLTAYDDLIVYGDDPGSPPARALTKRLLETGYKSVRLFPGGLKEWKAAQLPTIQAQGPTPPSNAPGHPPHPTSDAPRP